jgi:hypothetical protein
LFFGTSELDSEGQLSAPGAVAGGSYGSEATIVWVCVRVSEDVTVECIEELSSKLESNLFRNGRSLDHSEVFLVVRERSVVGLESRLIAKTVRKARSCRDVRIWIAESQRVVPEVLAGIAGLKDLSLRA